ncbi:autotransporter outer membrane beta-barrel domain-containing protein [Cupriavidus necator]|uniref:autotransporter outer membrane beta-barrel domain-containing protein n=1 Tax=Cupriavidus necator TaxID=106590 RepID=UPI001EE6804C|nr:autotransporter outer membrane beta-barrel domain-containing protein [Cupriavidus necator]
MQYGSFDNKVEGDGLPTVGYGANGWAISGETGYAFPLRGGWVAEPQAQLVYVKYGADDVSEPNGTRITGADSSGVVTRVGARLHRTFLRVDGRKIQPYATLNWWHAGIGKRWRGWANVAGAWGAQSFYQYALRAGVKYAW